MPMLVRYPAPCTMTLSAEWKLHGLDVWAPSMYAGVLVYHNLSPHAMTSALPRIRLDGANGLYPWCVHRGAAAAVLRGNRTSELGMGGRAAMTHATQCV